MSTQEKMERCQTCGHKPVDGCSHVDCPNRRTLTASPPERMLSHERGRTPYYEELWLMDRRD